jgi:hypothetical protein
VGGAVGLVEVMRITLDNQWVAAKKKMPSELQNRLVTFALRSKLNINLMIAPPLGLNTPEKREA